MKNYAIIVAGGSGTRFGGAVPKQFVPLCGKPVLMHTINKFASYFQTSPSGGSILVVLPKVHVAMWKSLCDQYRFTVPHLVVEGGETRYHSVLNALNAIEVVSDGDVVAVHDGVRPLVSLEVIEAAFNTARQQKSAIPVVAMTDSVRALDAGGGSHALDRAALRAVQTPQAFDLSLLKSAYLQPYEDTFTDDASVYERLGKQVELIDGDERNIKITSAKDLSIAQMLMDDE